MKVRTRKTRRGNRKYPIRRKSQPTFYDEIVHSGRSSKQTLGHVLIGEGRNRPHTFHSHLVGKRRKKESLRARRERQILAKRDRERTRKEPYNLDFIGDDPIGGAL